MLHLGSQSDEDQSLVLFVMKIRQLLGAVKQSRPARDTITWPAKSWCNVCGLSAARVTWPVTISTLICHHYTNPTSTEIAAAQLRPLGPLRRFPQPEMLSFVICRLIAANCVARRTWFRAPAKHRNTRARPAVCPTCFGLDRAEFASSSTRGCVKLVNLGTTWRLWRERNAVFHLRTCHRLLAFQLSL